MDAAAVLAAAFAAYGIAHYYIFGDTAQVFRSSRLSDIGLGGFADLRNPILAGIYYGMFSVWLFVRTLERSWSLKTIVMVVAIVILNTYIFLTYSRTAWVGCVVAYSFSALLFRNKKAILLLGICSIHFLLMLALVSGGLVIGSKNVDEPQPIQKSSRIEPVIAQENQKKLTIQFNLEELTTLTQQKSFRGLSWRDEIWKGVFEKIKEKPFIGHGADASFAIPFNNGKNISTHAHNVYLQLYMKPV